MEQQLSAGFSLDAVGGKELTRLPLIHFLNALAIWNLAASNTNLVTRAASGASWSTFAALLLALAAVLAQLGWLRVA